MTSTREDRFRRAPLVVAFVARGFGLLSFETREDASHKSIIQNNEHETDKICRHRIDARRPSIPRPAGVADHQRGAAEFHAWLGRRHRRLSRRYRQSRAQPEVRWPFRPVRCLTRALQRTAAAWSIGRRRVVLPIVAWGHWFREGHRNSRLRCRWIRLKNVRFRYSSPE
jgi:hypothetical protein